MNMKIDKIIDLNDNKNKIRFTYSQTRKVADMLERSNIFENYINIIRYRFGIPIDGFDESSPTESYIKLISNNKLIDRFVANCERLTERVRLPYTWLESIMYFAMHNIFLVPSRTILYHYPALFTDPFPIRGVTLIINEKLSKSEFHELIDMRWNKISKDMKLLKIPKVNKMVRADWAKRIVELRDTNPKTPFAKVATQLEIELHDKGTDVDISEDYAKILYSRWKHNPKSNTVTK